MKPWLMCWEIEGDMNLRQVWNLIISQGVNPYAHWVSGLFLGQGAGRVRKKGENEVKSD